MMKVVNMHYVINVELNALTEIFDVSYKYLIEGKEKSCFSISRNYDFSPTLSAYKIIFKNTSY